MGKFQVGLAALVEVGDDWTCLELVPLSPQQGLRFRTEVGCPQLKSFNAWWIPASDL